MDYSFDLQKYVDSEIKVLEALDIKAISEVMNVFEKARKNGNRIFICGNGGSASIASHFCCDFNKGVSEHQDKKYNFECLSDNVATMMAVANDISYDEVFRFPLKNKMQEGDVLVGISGSGNSKNVVNAFNFAKTIKNSKTVALVGYSGGELKNVADYCIHVNLDNMQISEDVFQILDHMMMYVLSNTNYETEE